MEMHSSSVVISFLLRWPVPHSPRVNVRVTECAQLLTDNRKRQPILRRILFSLIKSSQNLLHRTLKCCGKILGFRKHFVEHQSFSLVTRHPSTLTPLMFTVVLHEREQVLVT